MSKIRERRGQRSEADGRDFLVMVILTVLFILAVIAAFLADPARASTPTPASPYPDLAAVDSTLDTDTLQIPRLMDEVTAILETMTAFQTVLWEQHQLGAISAESWLEAVALATYALDAAFLALQSAQAVLAARAAYTGQGDACARRLRAEEDLRQHTIQFTLRFWHYVEYAIKTLPTEEVSPWLRKK